jgi:hypothetical protein
MSNRIQINAAAATDPFAAIPADTYNVRIVDVKMGESKKGAPMLTLQYEVQGGEHVGYRIFDRLVVDGTNKFANWRVKQLCEAAGCDPDDFDIDDLLNGSFDAEVTIQSSEEYGDSNNVRKILL